MGAANKTITLETVFALLGVVVGAMAIVLALVHSKTLKSIRTDITKTQDQIDKSLTATEEVRQQTLAALGLHEILVTDNDLQASVQRLSSDFAEILVEGDPLLINLARRNLAMASQIVDMGAQGHISLNADTFEDAESLAGALLDTTSQGDEFWASSLVHSTFWTRAGAYLQQNREKITEGVTIRRVFVFDDQTAFEDEQAQKQMALQVASGIKVYYLVNPPVPAKDLVVVRKLIADSSPSEFVNASGAEFQVAPDRRIDRIDIFSANTVRSKIVRDKVRNIWYELHGLSDRATAFDANIAHSSPTDVSDVQL